MAADPSLVQYIKRQVDGGFGKEQIYQALLAAGWTKEQVNEAIYEIMGKRPEARQAPAQAQPNLSQKPSAEVSSETPQAPGFFWKFRNVISHPGNFFEVIKKREPGMGQSLKFYVLILAIHLLIGIIAMFASVSILSVFSAVPFMSYVSGMGSLLFGIGLLQMFLSFFVSLGGMFVGAVTIHFFVYMFGGRKGFEQTYKVLAYVSLLSLLVWPLLPLVYLAGFPAMYVILAVLASLGVWSLYIMVKGLSRLHEISGLRALAAVLIPLLIPVIIAFIFAMGVFFPMTLQ
jgi:hypothetical protein